MKNNEIFISYKKNDYMKEQRINALENMNLDNCYAAKNIIDDLKSELIQ